MLSEAKHLRKILRSFVTLRMTYVILCSFVKELSRSDWGFYEEMKYPPVLRTSPLLKGDFLFSFQKSWTMMKKRTRQAVVPTLSSMTFLFFLTLSVKDQEVWNEISCSNNDDSYKYINQGLFQFCNEFCIVGFCNHLNGLNNDHDENYQCCKSHNPVNNGIC